MKQFGLIKSFEIDNGELRDLTQQECFVLGYELAQIDQLLVGDTPIHRQVHADNRSRIETSCQDAGREFTLSWMDVDPSESWMMLHVAPR